MTTEQTILNTLHAITDNNGGHRTTTATIDNTDELNIWIDSPNYYVLLKYTLAGNAATLLSQRGSDNWITDQTRKYVERDLTELGYWTG